MAGKKAYYNQVWVIVNQRGEWVGDYWGTRKAAEAELKTWQLRKYYEVRRATLTIEPSKPKRRKNA